MLELLIRAIHKEGTLQPAVLADQLNTSPAMVEIMLADLKRMGYLQAVDTACGETCGGCPLSGGCASPGERGSLWRLGRRSPTRQSSTGDTATE